MAFAGVQANRTTGLAADGDFVNYMKIDALTLNAFVATPAAIANADAGELTTAAAGANQNEIPNTITFGKGRGLWVAGDEYRVKVTIQDVNAVQQNAATGASSLVRVAAGYPQVAAGDLLIRLHNIGNQNSGALQIWLQFNAERE